GGVGRGRGGRRRGGPGRPRGCAHPSAVQVQADRAHRAPRPPPPHSPQQMPQLLRSPARMSPSLLHHRPHPMLVDPRRASSRATAPLPQPLDPFRLVAGHPLVPRLATDAELPTQLTYRLESSLHVPDKPTSLIHRSHPFPGHDRPPGPHFGVTYVLRLFCNLCLYIRPTLILSREGRGNVGGVLRTATLSFLSTLPERKNTVRGS